MEKTDQKIMEELRAKASGLLSIVSAMARVDRSGLDFQMLCADVTIQFLEFSEKISRTDFAAAEAFVWHDIANAAAQISFHTLEMQSADEEGIAGHLKMIVRHAAHIHDTANLPGEFIDPTGPACETNLTEKGSDDAGEDENAGPLAEVKTEDRKERLRQEIKALREKLVSLAMEKENLEHGAKNRLEAEYTLKIGVLLSELYRLQTELRYIQRKITLTRAAEAVRKRQPDVESRLEKEFEEYQKKFTEYIKKKQEAEEYLRKHSQKYNSGYSAETFNDFISKSLASRKDGADEEQRDGCEGAHGSETGAHSDAGSKSSSGDQAASEGADQKKEEDPPVKDAAYRKKLYRKIVKAMHPDLHPGQSEQEKELFKQAIAAYEDWDLATLERIYAMIENGTGPAEPGEEPIEKLIREKQMLLILIRQMQESIQTILHRFPFTEQELLNDPDKLAARQEEIRRKIENVRRQLEEYTKYYEKMVKTAAEEESETQDGRKQPDSFY